MNCAALDGCQVSGMVLRLSSQEHPHQGSRGVNPVLQGRIIIGQSHLDRAARRQVLPCFGRLERAMASDPLPLPKTAMLGLHGNLPAGGGP